MRLRLRFDIVTLLAMAALVPGPATAQVKTEVPAAVPGAKPVAVERIKIHGASLEGNLEGDAVDRDVLVLLPPSYAKERSRRYPVVYALHGYSIGAEQWSQEIHVPQTIEGAFAQGSREMIVVLPDSKTAHNGSMYSSSVTTGDFERFIATDVVAYVDAHYRTLPDRRSRGLVGHSMGGYGATRIGMKHADVFGSLYIMSPCCLSARGAGPANTDLEKAVESAKAPSELAGLSFGMRAQLATAAAWSPNPKKPPFYFDLPPGTARRGPRSWPVGGQRAAGVPGPVRRELRRYAPSRSTSATRTACGSTPASCTKRSTITASRNGSRSIPARTRAPWPSASRTTCCPSSATACAPTRGASDANAEA